MSNSTGWNWGNTTEEVSNMNECKTENSLKIMLKEREREKRERVEFVSHLWKTSDSKQGRFLTRFLVQGCLPFSMEALRQSIILQINDTL